MNNNNDNNSSIHSNNNNNNNIAINYTNNNCCTDNDINLRSEIHSSKTTQPFIGGSVYPSPMMNSCRLEYYRKPNSDSVDEIAQTSPQKFNGKKIILDESYDDVAFENQSFFGSSSGRSNQQSVIRVASKRINFDNKLAGGLKPGSFTAGLECMEQSVFPTLRANSGCQVEQLSGVLPSNQQLQIQTNLRGYEMFRNDPSQEVYKEIHNPLNNNNSNSVNFNSINYAECLKSFTIQKSRQTHPYFQGLQYYQHNNFNTPQDLQQLQRTNVHYCNNNNEELSQNSCCYESANLRPSCLVNSGYQGLDGGMPPDQKASNSVKVQQNSVIQSVGCSYAASQRVSSQMSTTFSPCNVRPVSNSNGAVRTTSPKNRSESNSAPLMASPGHDNVNKDLVKDGHRSSTLSEPELGSSDIRGSNSLMTAISISSKLFDSTFPSSRDHLSTNEEKEEVECQTNGRLARSVTQNKTETSREFPNDITFAFDEAEFRPVRHQGTLHHYHDPQVEGQHIRFSQCAGRMEQNLFRAGSGSLSQGASLSRMLIDDDYFDFWVGGTGMNGGYNPHCAMVPPNCDANC